MATQQKVIEKTAHRRDITTTERFAAEVAPAVREAVIRERLTAPSTD